MSYQATVCNVMIASPGDVQVERNIVRSVIHEWNAVHSADRETVLLPLGWETHSTPELGDRPQAIINRQVLRDADLLVAVFWTRLGTPTGEAESGTVEEIERHIEAGRPALIYFSGAPVAPDSVDPDQYRALKAFRDECRTRGLFQVYDTPQGFQDLIRSHLAMTINSHPYFTDLLQDQSPGELPETYDTGLGIPSLSSEAKQLLVEAADPASDGKVMVIRADLGVSIFTNGSDLSEPGDARSEATWEGAVDELVHEGFLIDVSYQGEIFRVTREGFKMADLLRP